MVLTFPPGMYNVSLKLQVKGLLLIGLLSKTRYFGTMLGQRKYGVWQVQPHTSWSHG